MGTGPLVPLRFALLALALAACETTQIKPLTSAADTRQLTSEEERLWHAGREFDQRLADTDQLYDDRALQAYVQGVMDKLYPEYAGSITARVADSPSLNAFALPNGSIYINTGMLARLDNEAQMATVLAHEGVHFTHKHGWQQQRSVTRASAFSTGFSMATGIPLLGELMAASSVYGFSRELEREADREGFERLRTAGYDVTQAPVTFEHLLAEVKALDIDEPYFFSTHPRLAERIQSFNELIGEHGKPGGERGEDRYRSMIAALQVEMLADYLEAGRYKSVLLILEREDAFTRYPPRARFYLGEAYRLRNKAGDTERAVKAYRAAIEAAPEFPGSYRALGIHHMKQKRPEQAEQYLDRYLELAPNAPDRGYIEVYRDSLRSEGR